MKLVSLPLMHLCHISLFKTNEEKSPLKPLILAIEVSVSFLYSCYMITCRMLLCHIKLPDLKVM